MSDEEHGAGGYRRGCRCEVCRAANAAIRREDRRRAAEKRAADAAARVAAPVEPMDAFADLGAMGLDLEPWQNVRNLRAALRDVPGDDARTRYLKGHALTLVAHMDNPSGPKLYPSLSSALWKVLGELGIVGVKKAPVDPEAQALEAFMTELAAGRASG